MIRRLLALGAASSLLASTAPASAGGSRPALRGIEEPSGVTRVGDRLLIVGDDEPGVYFALHVTGAETGLVPLDPARIRRHELRPGLAALDLEGIAALPDGRIVVLSERFPGLFDDRGVVVPYGRRMMELGGRGPEGLAVLAQDDGRARVAVLWEGGYPEPDRLPPDMSVEVSRHALRPRVMVHRLAAGAGPLEMSAADVEREVELQVEKPPGEEPFAQRFRSPDLVWHRLTPAGAASAGEDGSWGWIVLLSSGWGERPAAGSVEECTLTEDGRPLRYCHRRLQRFAVDGTRVGEPFDLDTVLPDAVRTSNWEGLGWFVPGEKLVLVYDEAVADRRIDPQQAFVMDLPAGW